jgi:hypothetical protein
VTGFWAGVVFAYVAPWSAVGLVLLLAWMLRRRRARRAVERLIGETRTVCGSRTW